MDKIVLSLLLFIIGNICSIRAQELSNALLWKIEKEGEKGTSYIFGTNALVSKSFLENIKAFRRAFHHCDVLISEVKYSQESIREISSLAIMRETTLNKLFTRDEYVDVAAYFQIKTGLDLKNYLQLKPLAIYLMLNAIKNREQGLAFGQDSAEPSINQFLQDEAQRKKKKILALESIQSQTEMLFNSFSNERQAALLLDLVRNEIENDAYNMKVFNCYVNQDLACLNEMLFFSNFSPDESRRLIKERNREWLPQIIRVIEMSNTFIAVGALHLPGEDGLLNLLQKQGFKLTPML